MLRRCWSSLAVMAVSVALASCDGVSASTDAAPDHGDAASDGGAPALRDAGMDAGQPARDAGNRARDGGLVLDAAETSDAARAHDAAADSGAAHEDAGSFAAVEEALCGELARALCEGARGCGCPLAASAEDVDACVTRTRGECAASLFVDFSDALRTGDAVADFDTLAACVARARVMAAACEPLPGETLFECERAIHAPVAAGASCNTLFCNDGDGHCGPARGGTCVLYPADGEPCTSACRRGSRCTGGSCTRRGLAGATCTGAEDCDDGLRCLDGHCHAAARPDEACASTDDCTPTLSCRDGRCVVPPTFCTSPEDCGARAFCIGGRITSCALPHELLAPCRGGAGCTTNAYCDDTTYLCTSRPGLDRPCGNGTECAAGLFCDPATVCCRALPARGEHCASGPVIGPPEVGPDGSRRRSGCADGLVCSSGTCVPPPGNAEACSDFGECAEGLGCDTSLVPRGTCVTLRAEGDACSSSLVCSPGLVCDRTTRRCRPRSPGGSPCSGDECVAGAYCRAGGRDTGTCTLLPLLDEPCEDRCESGLFCEEHVLDGTCTPSLCESIVPAGG